MNKESSLADAAKSALAFAKSQKAKAGKAIQKAYRPIKSISPVAIGSGLAVGHIAGGYSGSAAAQSDMYHLGYDDAMKKQAALTNFLKSGISGARGFVTKNGTNSSRAFGLATSIQKQAGFATNLGRTLGSAASKGMNVLKDHSPQLHNAISEGTTKSLGYLQAHPNVRRGVVGAGVVGAVATSLPKRPEMQKSSGLYQQALAYARLKGRTNPLATKIVAGTVAAGVGLGATHAVDEKLDGAAGRAAVYNYRKQNGSI